MTDLMLTFRVEAAELCQLVDNCVTMHRQSHNKPENRVVLEHLINKVSQKHQTLISLIQEMKTTHRKVQTMQRVISDNQKVDSQIQSKRDTLLQALEMLESAPVSDQFFTNQKLPTQQISL